MQNKKTFFGFAVADSMFPNSCIIDRTSLSVEQVKEHIEAGVIPCFNASHEATVFAMNSRFGINLEIPEVPPRVSLNPGDSVIVMGVRGLPRLTDRRHYSFEEISSATFVFSIYTVR
ncbi:hypothetical protein EBU94_02510 [bacterium]|nr:hypothetical protein [bacterium]NBO36471.1 hypothetical protein [bacterium]